jgi:predicted lipid-binding transport protein (Tim44 family)
MAARYPIYKGLQKPLIYRGFKGKFIYWGIGSLVGGLLLGGLVGALTSMYLGGFLTIILICGGLGFTFYRQKDGLHAKKRHTGVVVHPVNLKITYAKRKKDGI